MPYLRDVFSGKKGMTLQLLATIILSLTFLMLTAYTLKVTFAGQEDKELELLCKNSISLRGNAVISSRDYYVTEEMRLTPVACTTIDKKIQGNREDAIEEIADLSARCWWMFNEGRYEEILASNPEQISSLFGFRQTENDCFVCYSLLMDANLGKEESIDANEIVSFMYDTQYPKVKGDVTYLDYIQSFGGPGRFTSLVGSGEDSVGNLGELHENHAYAVVFLAKNGNVDEDLLTVLGAGKIAVGLGGAVVLGAATGGFGWVVVGGIAAATVLTASGYNDLSTALYESERDVSAIYLDDLRSAQARCHSGDLRGN